jgi:ferredoxin
MMGADAYSGRWLMRVAADWDSCEANGICAGLVPEVFEVDDQDNLHILLSEIPSPLEQQVRHAVGSCPKMALRLED